MLSELPDTALVDDCQSDFHQRKPPVSLFAVARARSAAAEFLRCTEASAGLRCPGAAAPLGGRRFPSQGLLWAWALARCCLGCCRGCCLGCCLWCCLGHGRCLGRCLARCLGCCLGCGRCLGCSLGRRLGLCGKPQPWDGRGVHCMRRLRGQVVDHFFLFAS